MVVGSNGAIRPVIGPDGGFGANPTNDLRSHYVTINTVFTGDESGSIPDSNDFRQIAVVKNPIEKANETATLSASNSMVVGNFYKILTIGTSSDATLGQLQVQQAVIQLLVKYLKLSLLHQVVRQVQSLKLQKQVHIIHVRVLQSLAGLASTYVADFAFEAHTGGTVGAKGIVVEYNNTSGVLHYIQNETTGFGVHHYDHFTFDECYWFIRCW